MYTKIRKAFMILFTAMKSNQLLLKTETDDEIYFKNIKHLVWQSLILVKNRLTFLADRSYFNPMCKKKCSCLLLEIYKTNTSILFTHLKDCKCINLRKDIAFPLWISHVLQRAQKLDDIPLSYTKVSAKAYPFLS